MIEISEEDLQKIHQAYVVLFDEKNPYAQIVLDDLRRFCRIEESCFHPDARVHAELEGRREVGIHILTRCKLSFEEFKRRIIINRALPQRSESK